MLTFIVADGSRNNVGGHAQQRDVEQLCDSAKDGQRHPHGCQLTRPYSSMIPDPSQIKERA